MAKNSYPNLFQKLTVLENGKCFIENEEYNDFIRKDLKNIIDKCSAATKEDAIVESYYNLINSSDYLILRCLLTFLKKYSLIDFYTYYYPGRIYSSHKKGLTQQDILVAYEKELAYVNKKATIKTEKKNLNPSVFERLDKYTTIEERQAHIHELKNNYEESLRLTMQENNYNNFIMNRENGLYRLLENALYKYDGKKFILEYNPLNINFECIKEFCNKYGIDIKMIERGESIFKDYLPTIKSLEDIRNLFNFYFMELQQIEYFSKSQDELWQECNNFVINNEEWLKGRKTSR